MASITRLSNSNYISSLYNNTNIISGLASGMDTESMIQSLTKSYQTKITQLQQKSTKVEWKQEAYRSIISKMYSFSNKYTSYTSSTNLLSQGFFNSARTSAAQGENAGKVNASGTSTSEVVLNSVDQLATAARFATSGNFDEKAVGDGRSVTASQGIHLLGYDSTTEENALQGSISLAYGSKTISIMFNDTDKIEAQQKSNGDWETRTEALARAINEKLSEEKLSLSGSSSSMANERIQAVANGNTVSFKPVDVNADGKDKAGNSIYIVSGSGAFKGISPNDSDEKRKTTSFQDPDVGDTKATYDGVSFYRQDVPNIEKISGKIFNITLDGTTKQINGPQITESGGGYWIGGTVDKNGKRTGGTYVSGNDQEQMEKDMYAAYTNELQKAVRKEFGADIKVSNANTRGTSLRLSFTAPEDSNLQVSSEAGDALKLGKTASNYLNTNKTLGELLGDKLNNLTPAFEDGTSNIKHDSKGNTLYTFTLNGVAVGEYTKDTDLATILSDINNSEAGVKASYSKTSREFVFTSKDTGAHTAIEFGDGLASEMFGNAPIAKGQYARDITGNQNMAGKKFSVEMENGEKIEFNFKGPKATLQNIEDRINKEILSGKNMTAEFSSNGSLYITDNTTGERYGVSSYGSGDQTAKELISALNEKNGYTAGQNARFTVTVNGSTKVMTRSSNKAEIDGMTVNFKGTFNEGYADAYTENKSKGSAALKEALKDFDEPVTFQEDIKADQVVDAVKNMIAEYNVMVAEIRTQYTTMPPKNSSGSIQTYEPLTDEDRADMSESAIEKYEEKAKQGLLFADSNLSNLYQGLVNIFNRTGADSTALANMGISTSYDTNSGASTIAFDESKFRSALENDFDGVVDMFTRTASENGGTDGIMQGMKTQLDRYGSTSGSVKGILVQQSGTPLSSLSLLDNAWQTEIDNYSSQIEKWVDKLESQIDRYTQQFARMETLINQMNSQSSALAGLMGGS